MPPKKESITNGNLQSTSKKEGKLYWQKWYMAVIGFLLLQIVFYYLITIYFQ
jgi:hypothetical protein